MCDRKNNKLFRKMKKNKKESDIQNYKDSKSAVQKAVRQNHIVYINNNIETDDPERDHPHKQKRFWNYCSSVLSPHQKDQIRKLEMIQRRAARHTTNRYRNTSGVTSMLDHLQWQSLESRRSKIN